MEHKELKKKTKSQLQLLLSESREKLRNFRFKAASNQLKNVQEIKIVKKIISRILTILNDKKDINKEKIK
ncbi:50S ribosomal protein L29 [Candidatus Falkowbacteria bacterium CG_4_9_14_3_um_filter_36_9]|uniref:Large ribosomal subunit protein uL29 n=2 Tax=Candidatus Falkowiibacteriota TaxID=1752728 RepID=A0A1J4TCG5_9BACT|nr:MAG: 50S ribosomal protein L29 [Candidatus Falkowbacteria bacterium CG1_02_37_44]PIV51876.1 MAG: 50S ribosomal protein L29 [Candidatus Falkowbacteria bacterium CG02_land_8_20_14_3_00_36_14]PIX12077.1 MAG: 50S ribosomal protein L29 [Candidatus Falkowbacteria bacterium CG_4_8_14_3_um_filter_36_11]PJA10850.1 MAG: 50S ribosomal protein L29 [Candidatus Falkowbacteria bacterium CG_4_10_14_0_2_um_filter_36_22]PJB20215.1 MAG: 50S ribosomal protein L29 [Candidatus Falkowbacteria bacterium CG_4_9_14_3